MTAARPTLRAARTVFMPLAIALLSLLAPAPAGAAQQLRVAEGGGAAFPGRSLVLAVPPGTGVSPSAVHVSENGRQITEAAVRPIANAAAGDFGVVLAIDTGPSMRGVPLERAMQAARALAAQRTGNQEIAIVTFDEHATVALPLTSDPAAIERALAQTPAVGHGAYIYSAMSLAVQQLAQAKIAAGAVILLSDGASRGARQKRGPQLTASAVGAAATAAHAQIYTVGLHDSSYTPERMSLLARVGGGAFIESTSSQLAEVFTQIEAGLTSAYVIHYRSPARPGSVVDVSVSVAGVPGSATLRYTAPGLPPAHYAGQPRHHTSYWTSSSALIVFSCIAAIVLSIGLAMLIGPRVFHNRLRRRIGAFTASGAIEPRLVAETSGEPRFARVAAMLDGIGWWRQLKSDMEIARVKHQPVELLIAAVLLTAAAAALLGVLFGTVLVSLIAIALGPISLRTYVTHKLRKQRELFSDQLPSHLQEVASAMRAGHSLVAAIATMAREAAEPSHSEWQQVVADEQLGVPLDEAMTPMAERMANDDVNQVALVASLHHRTGGNMAEVLDRVADSVRERAELRRELRALTAQARLSRYIVTSLPPFVAVVVTLLDPGYIKPLFHTAAGVILVVVAVGLLTGASLIMRAITDVEA